MMLNRRIKDERQLGMQTPKAIEKVTQKRPPYVVPSALHKFCWWHVTMLLKIRNQIKLQRSYMRAFVRPSHRHSCKM
jgi:hypothetical protein